jgi:protease-4
MKYLVHVAVPLLCGTLISAAQEDFGKYYSYTDLSLSSPGALKFGLYGFDNPALLTYVRESDFQFTWTDAVGRWNDFNRWGLFTASSNIGLGLVKTKAGGSSIVDYRISTAFGSKAVGLGLGFGWTGGAKGLFNRSNVWTLGMLIRPSRHVSVGLIGSKATSGDGKEAVIDVAGRPWGSELVTLFADYGIQNGQSLAHGGWSAGAVVEALPGIRLVGRYFDTKTFRFGLEFSLGQTGLASQTSYNRDGKHLFNSYSVRLGASDRTVLSRLMARSRYVEMNLYGRLKYQRYMLFDRSQTLAQVLSAIDAAKNDDAVAGIALNTSGMEINGEMLWEVRERLREFRSAGKNVVVFVDRPTMQEYHFASVAHKIVLDPTGMIVLQGFVRGRTFLKGTLEKLGIGFDEWRLFKYKSADEVFSRENMSEGEREQTHALVDNSYLLARKEICEGRNFTREKFDSLINEQVIFLPQDALEEGLVDTLGRWEEVETMVERMEGSKKGLVHPASLAEFRKPYDNRWGERPRIAVVYALGACAMDRGIKARTLVKDVEAAANDTRVKAIVLRVDSPGGDGMASDYIAEAVKRGRKTKPVIVSQGAVAASGGYWLSMYADTIVAAPNTITGSIGVIGGWFYDKGLKEKLGMTTDLVKVGEHADVGFGFALPFLGIGLPDRNLTDQEREKVERALALYYKDFVKKVAEGRKMEYSAVDSIGQGRVWSGREGKQVGLVDVLGGLQTAIRIARERAGIAAGEEVDIVEMPRPGLFDPSVLASRLFGVEAPRHDDQVLDYLKFLIEHNGQPLPVMPMEEIPLSLN